MGGPAASPASGQLAKGAHTNVFEVSMPSGHAKAASGRSLPRRSSIPRRAKNHAGNVIRLPRGPHELIHPTHEVLQYFIRVDLRQIPDRREPTLVAILFAVGIKSFHHAVGIQN